jgi:hypothetical protein
LDHASVKKNGGNENMKKNRIGILLSALLLAAMAIVPCVSAAQASNYDFSGLSTPTAANAVYYQNQMGYNPQMTTDAWADDAYDDMENDAIFFFNGHGILENGVNGGGIAFTNYRIVASNPDSGDYSLNYLNNEMRDLLLAVYDGCYTGRTSANHGNLVDMSITKGADNVIGFTGLIGATKSNYWSDQFWYRTRTGESIGSAAVNAKNDAYFYGTRGYDGVDTLVVKGSNPSNTYLTPARMGNY